MSRLQTIWLPHVKACLEEQGYFVPDDGSGFSDDAKNEIFSAFAEAVIREHAPAILDYLEENNAQALTGPGIFAVTEGEGENARMRDVYSVAQLLAWVPWRLPTETAH